MLKFLVKVGAMVKSCAMMYKEVVQTLILYGSESWIVTDETVKVLEGFHHRISRRIMGKIDRRVGEEDWE